MFAIGGIEATSSSRSMEPLSYRLEELCEGCPPQEFSRLLYIELQMGMYYAPMEIQLVDYF